MRQLRVFVAVAARLHFGRASEALHVSQSSVSQELRRLERGLGLQLFERTSRTVRLTAAGESLREAAETAVAAADAFSDLARRHATGTRGVRVAATPSVMDGLMPQLLRAAERERSPLAVEDVPIETGEAVKALAAGADVVIGRFLELPSRYSCAVLRTEPVFAAVAAGNELAGRAEVSLAELADIPLLLWPREQHPRYYDRLMEICADGGLDPLVLVSNARVIGSRSYLIRENRAFALLPRASAAQTPAGVAAVAVSGAPTLPLAIGWLTDDPREEVHRFVALTRRVAAAS